jgi:hypothetical protein
MIKVILWTFRFSMPYVESNMQDMQTATVPLLDKVLQDLSSCLAAQLFNSWYLKCVR